MIRARIEPKLKDKAEGLLNSLGLNATCAITLFYHQILLQNGLPFEVALPPAQKRSRLAEESQKALIEKMKTMSPEERLEAFYNHSQLLATIEPPAMLDKGSHDAG
jgi:DNA-damage-inducible protein J